MAAVEKLLDNNLPIAYLERNVIYTVLPKNGTVYQGNYRDKKVFTQTVSRSGQTFKPCHHLEYSLDFNGSISPTIAELSVVVISLVLYRSDGLSNSAIVFVFLNLGTLYKSHSIFSSCLY